MSFSVDRIVLSFRAAAFAVVVLVFRLPLFSAAFTGTSFEMPIASVGGAGGAATSANFSQQANVAEALPFAVWVGPNFTINSGYFGGFIVPATTPSSASAVIDPNSEQSIVITGPGGTITVVVPAGAFSSVVVLTVSLPSGFSALSSNIATLTGTGLGVVLENDLGLKPLRVIMQYQDSDIQSLNEARLRLARDIAAEGRWVPLASTVDASNNTLTSYVSDMGTLQIVDMAPGGDVENVFVYPNPLRPSQGNTEMRFTKVPVGATISIFDLRGGQVREITSDGTGQATWDGRNSSGEDAASGVYLALIRQGSSHSTVKVAVER